MSHPLPRTNKTSQDAAVKNNTKLIRRTVGRAGTNYSSPGSWCRGGCEVHHTSNKTIINRANNLWDSGDVSRVTSTEIAETTGFHEINLTSGIVSPRGQDIWSHVLWRLGPVCRSGEPGVRGAGREDGEYEPGNNRNIVRTHGGEETKPGRSVSIKIPPGWRCIIYGFNFAKTNDPEEALPLRGVCYCLLLRRCEHVSTYVVQELLCRRWKRATYPKQV